MDQTPSLTNLPLQTIAPGTTFFSELQVWKTILVELFPQILLVLQFTLIKIQLLFVLTKCKNLVPISIPGIHIIPIFMDLGLVKDACNIHYNNIKPWSLFNDQIYNGCYYKNSAHIDLSLIPASYLS